MLPLRILTYLVANVNCLGQSTRPLMTNLLLGLLTPTSRPWLYPLPSVMQVTAWLNVFHSQALGLHLYDREFRLCLQYWLGLTMVDEDSTTKGTNVTPTERQASAWAAIFLFSPTERAWPWVVAAPVTVSACMVEITVTCSAAGRPRLQCGSQMPYLPSCG